MNDLPLVIGNGLTDKQIKFINAYATNYCNITKAMQSIGMSRETYYEWGRKSDAFKDAVASAEESLKDRWQDEIARHVFEDRNPIVLNKFAPVVLKDRGYADSKDINLTGQMTNDNEVVVTIVDGGEISEYEESE